MEEAAVLAGDQQDHGLAGRKTVGLDDGAAVDAVRPQRGERRLRRGVAPDAARDRGADLLAREIDRDIGRAASGLRGNVVDREQLSGLRQRLDRTAQRVRDENARAAHLHHHALPAEPSAGKRSSTASRTARRPATMTSSGPPMPSRAWGFGSSLASARRTAGR